MSWRILHGVGGALVPHPQLDSHWNAVGMTLPAAARLGLSVNTCTQRRMGGTGKLVADLKSEIPRFEFL